jgi:hypothetical protein
MQHFSAIERASFKKIFEDLPITYSPMSARTLKRVLEERFVDARQALKKDLQKTCNTIALSVDGWTSSNNIAILAYWPLDNGEF